MKFKILTLFIFLTYALNAQNDWRIAKHTSSLDDVERLVLPRQNNDLLMQVELDRRGPNIAPKFAVNIPVNITPDSHGTWDYTPSGKAVWRLKVHSKNAKSINLGFTKYFMPEGGILVIYSTDQQRVTGPFSPADNEEHQELWTPIFPADELVIEVQVPIQNKSLLQLELTSINHDFLGFGGLLSGSCNVDVLCGVDDGFPEIEEHRDIIQSVAVIGLGGGVFCTGFLVNNAAQDCTPYFMTANHCGINSGNAASLVAYWNYQNSTCREPGSTASGQNGNGVLNDFNSGSIFRAGSGNSDFTLVELDDAVSETANAFLAGWDNGGEPPTSAVCVHHPNTEEKRISFENNPLIMTNGFGNAPSSNFTHVRVVDWDLGTTEPGSSGSPLFDQNERVVGQLHGGGAACGNNSSDWYGAIATSWNGGSASSRLRDWLDPDDTGIVTIDGIEASFCTFSIETVQTNINACPDGEAVYTLIPSLSFVSEVTLELSGLPVGVDFSFSTNPVAPGDTTYLTLSNFSSLALDDYIFNTTAADSVNMVDQMLVLSVIDTPVEAPSLVLPADGASNISYNPSYNWTEVASATSYYIEIATDEVFTNIIKEATVVNSAYNSGGLEPETTYYWRVTAINICGEILSSTSSFLTAPDVSISVSPSTVAICNSEVANFTLSLGSSFSNSGAMLSASGLPAGATISYSQNPAPPNTSINISIENLEAAPGGNYSITIIADDGTNSNSSNLTIVLEAPPLPASLNMPIDNATEISLSPQFLWIPSTGANEYIFELSTDIDFSNIVATTTTNITVYTIPTELIDNTTYYWRINAEGDCGGSQSVVRSFTTIIIDDIGTLSNALIDIRPNPTKGLLTISLSEALPDDLNVEVYSINGQRLLRQVRNGDTRFEVSLEDYPDGVYLLKIMNAENVLTRKIVVQR